MAAQSYKLLRLKWFRLQSNGSSRRRKAWPSLIFLFVLFFYSTELRSCLTVYTQLGSSEFHYSTALSTPGASGVENKTAAYRLLLSDPVKGALYAQHR
jgi:hypothetical protein